MLQEVFVKYLSADCNRDHLKQHLEDFEDDISKIELYNTDNAQKIGLIQFTNRSSAEEVVKSLTGSYLKGRKLEFILDESNDAKVNHQADGRRIANNILCGGCRDQIPANLFAKHAQGCEKLNLKRNICKDEEAILERRSRKQKAAVMKKIMEERKAKRNKEEKAPPIKKVEELPAQKDGAIRQPCVSVQSVAYDKFAVDSMPAYAKEDDIFTAQGAARRNPEKDEVMSREKICSIPNIGGRGRAQGRGRGRGIGRGRGRGLTKPQPIPKVGNKCALEPELASLASKFEDAVDMNEKDLNGNEIEVATLAKRHDEEQYRSKYDNMDQFVVTSGFEMSEPSPVLHYPQQQGSNAPVSQEPNAAVSVRAKTTVHGRPRPADHYQPASPKESDSCRFTITHGLPVPSSSKQSFGQQGQVYPRNAFGNADSYAVQTAAFAYSCPQATYPSYGGERYQDYREQQPTEMYQSRNLAEVTPSGAESGAEDMMPPLEDVENWDMNKNQLYAGDSTPDVGEWGCHVDQNTIMQQIQIMEEIKRNREEEEKSRALAIELSGKELKKECTVPTYKDKLLEKD
eukprot:TRINITY_DN2165_c0_g2_i4.p1 TRINITY_DN2165_c0_g2~~TRINITY_DN2165_c0_g2_i4.p1  ORF type:complete len:571 (-),score=125.56 TRINITY_DN2165_c0_g2_i4:934-2646(-)